MQDLVEGDVYILSSLRKIVLGADNTTFYYVATVNGACRLKMSADVSTKMDQLARERQFSEFQMLNVHMKMVAIRSFNWALGHHQTKLVLISVNRYGGFDDRVKRFACNGDDPGKGAGGGGSGMAPAARGRGVHFNV